MNLKPKEDSPYKHEFNDVTLLVSSCDKYEDTWHPFFELLHIYGNGFSCPIVLNTEKKQYSNAEFIGK